MRMILTVVALTVAVPADAQTSPSAHAGHSTAPAKTTGGKASQVGNAGSAHAGHGEGCQKMADGKMMMMRDGKMMDCPGNKAAGKSVADPHAGHDMSKR